MSCVRVMVVEDNFYTRFGMVSFLRAQPGIEVVGEAADGESALTLFEQLVPDVMVLDLRMPRMDGVQLTASLCGRAPGARILVLSHYRGDEDVFQALKAGAQGYLSKESSGATLLDAIRTVAAGERFLPPDLLQVVSNRSPLTTLTRRECHVLAQIADGASNREAAEGLKLSERTIALYVSSILSKLGARSRTEAVSIGRRRGILKTDDY